MAHDELGKMELELTADAAQHDATLKQAEATADQYADRAGKSIEGASDKMQSGMKKAAHEAHAAVKALEKFVGIPALIAGVATAFFEMGKAIREQVTSALETGEEKARKFLDALDATKPKENLQALQKQMSDLNAQLGESLAGGHGAIGRFFYGEANPEKLQAQLKELGKTAKALQAQANAETKRTEEKKALEDLNKREKELAADALDEYGKAKMQTETKIAELRKKYDTANATPAVKAALEETVKAEYAARDKALKDITEKQNKEQEAERKRYIDHTKELGDDKHRLAMAVADDEKKARLEYEREMSKLRMELMEAETAEQRKIVLETMKLAGEVLSKELAKPLMEAVKQFQQIANKAEDTTYTMGAMLREIRGIRGGII